MKNIQQAPHDRKNQMIKATAVALALALTAGSANAAIDIAPIITLITDAVTAAVAIGIAFLGFTAGQAIYRKLRGST